MANLGSFFMVRWSTEARSSYMVMFVLFRWPIEFRVTSLDILCYYNVQFRIFSLRCDGQLSLVLPLLVYHVAVVDNLCL